LRLSRYEKKSAEKGGEMFKPVFLGSKEIAEILKISPREIKYFEDI
jgi:hypothetical protein